MSKIEIALAKAIHEASWTPAWESLSAEEQEDFREMANALLSALHDDTVIERLAQYCYTATNAGPPSWENLGGIVLQNYLDAASTVVEYLVRELVAQEIPGDVREAIEEHMNEKPKEIEQQDEAN